MPSRKFRTLGLAFWDSIAPIGVALLRQTRHPFGVEGMGETPFLSICTLHVARYPAFGRSSAIALGSRADTSNKSPTTSVSVSGKQGLRGRDKGAKTTREIQSTARRDKVPSQTPPIRGYSQRAGKSLFVGDCVVDDPVLSEPVSSLNSLLAGKMQGIFANFNRIRWTSARLNH